VKIQYQDFSGIYEQKVMSEGTMVFQLKALTHRHVVIWPACTNNYALCRLYKNVQQTIQIWLHFKIPAFKENSKVLSSFLLLDLASKLPNKHYSVN